jgi:hypothetical protein
MDQKSQLASLAECRSLSRDEQRDTYERPDRVIEHVGGWRVTIAQEECDNMFCFQQ